VRYRDPVFLRVERTPDLVYGTAIDIPTGQRVDLRLDLYQPEGDTETARPLYVFIHGGGFTMGDKSAGRRWAEEFARRGWVAVSIGYRLRQGNVATEGIPAAVSDARQALRWLDVHAQEHRLDMSRTVVGGSSAGAITALYLTYTEMEKGLEDANVSVAGVMDLWGALYGRERDMAAGEPPLIIVHGTEDEVVPYRFAESLRDRAEEVGIPYDFRPLQGVGHGSGDVAGISRWTAEFFYPFLWPDVVPTPSPAEPTAPATSEPTPTQTSPAPPTGAPPANAVIIPVAYTR
jgi:acetyl esterase/lipase